MNLSKKIAHHWTIKLPVVAMYLLFFTVQIFFNIDTGANSFTRYQHSLSISKVLVRAGNIKQGELKTPARSKIRLNKRYEPSSIPPLETVVSDVPVVYAAKETAGLYQCRFYASLFLSPNGLRGPPVA